MTNKQKAEIWEKIAQTIEQKGQVVLGSNGLCFIGGLHGLSHGDTYGIYDEFDRQFNSGVPFLLGNNDAAYDYLWEATEKGAEERVIAAQLMACYLKDAPDDSGKP